MQISELKEQYTKIEEMRQQNDVPREDMIAAYDDFLSDHDTLMGRIEGEFSNLDEERVGLKEAIIATQDRANIQIGIPTQIFADGGAHYATLLAEKVTELTDQADVMRPDGETENYEDFLSDKLCLYEQAKRELDSSSLTVESYLHLDPEFVERMSGYSAEYLDKQIEALKIEEEAIRQPYADDVELESDKYLDPELGSVDDTSSSPVVVGNIISLMTFKL